MDSITAVNIVAAAAGRTAAGEGGVALWERDGGVHDLSWSYHCSRRLAAPPLLALRPAAGSQVWGACADGTLYVWLAEAAVAEANEMLSKRAFLGEVGGGSNEASTTAVHRAVAVPLLKLMRVALDELRRARDDYSKLLGEVNAAWAQIEADRQLIGQKQDKLAVALNVETIARIDAEERRAALVKEVDALQYDLSHLGQSRDQALALKAARESEVGRLKKVESKLSQRLKTEEEVGRQLAEARVQMEKLRAERDRAHSEMRAAKRDLLDLQKEQQAENDALVGERDALEAGLEQRSVETSALTEALRAREASEAAARAEATRLRTALMDHEEEGARMKHEREQMRAANARMQGLLERLRAKMGQDVGIAHMAQLGAPDAALPYDGEVEEVSCRPQITHSSPSHIAYPPPPSQAWEIPQPQKAPPRVAQQQAGCSSSRRRPSCPPGPETNSTSRLLKPTVSSVVGARGAGGTPSTGRGVAGRGVGGGRFGRIPPERTRLPTPRSTMTAPPSVPETVAPPRQPAFDATPAVPTGAGVDEELQPHSTPRVERRTAALLMQLAELRSWLQVCLKMELPPGDLPALLQDGEVLCALADAAMPGVAAPLVGSAPLLKVQAFVTSCRQLGVPEDELLAPEAVVRGQASASAVARALTALAREASARALLPPLGS